MHVPHLIVAPVVGLKDEFIAPVLDERFEVGNLPTWFSSYSVGGRWPNFFENKYGVSGLTNPNVLPLSHEKVDMVLRDAVKHQDELFNAARHRLLGSKVAVADFSGNVFGLPVESNQVKATEVTRDNMATSASWTSILGSSSLSEAKRLESTDDMFALDTVTELVDLIAGNWISGSQFYDLYSWSASPLRMLQALQTGHINESKLNEFGLVMVDFYD